MPTVQAIDSTTLGYLQPAPSPAPLDDEDLREFLQQLVVGVTGMPGNLVRPRWQPEEPNLPAFGTDWAAIGKIHGVRDWNAAITHQPDGTDQLDRNEQLEVMCSFYGPNAEANCALLSDGLQIEQNRDVMTANDFGLVDASEPTVLPVLIKQKWTWRVDVMLVMNRHIRRIYPVRNLAEADGTILVADETLIVNP